MTSTNQQSDQHVVHHRSDYTSPNFSIDNASFTFELNENDTLVHATINFQRLTNESVDCVLHGEHMELIDLKVDNTDWDYYEVNHETLVIRNVPAAFRLNTIVRINPKENTTLNGLYVSSGNFATQCEPHGFRRITYFLDRPDVLTVFNVKIIADKKKFPVLLSNGNLVSEGDLDDGKHFVEWQDPTLKPCYLFALVAGDFDLLQGEYITMSKRKVDLRIYVEKGKLNQADFALKSLQDAMRWDEDVFGREYELDIYMIVAVSDFNFGAMENKGLNIFNDQYILANPKLATDQDYTNILGVVGHEYFHNWSGNRVTCRDWFQLSLKEGLTIFRDQNFTADMTSGVNKRIGDVFVIKNYQFAEDAGPMSHPIRPDSYVSMNNFYTTTVYNKGAEVIRMIQTILGQEKFSIGMDEYFNTNDGLAVTTDDFVSAMEVSSGYDFTQFRFWYSQAGTPLVKVSSDYNSDKSEYRLKFEQSIPNHDDASVLHIPIRFGFISDDGQEISYNCDGVDGDIIHLKNKEEEYIFKNVSSKPVLSLLRNFSAPIQIEYQREYSELSTILKHDTDLVARWDAASTLIQHVIQNIYHDHNYNVPSDIMSAFHACITDENIDKEFVSKLFTMPTIKLLMLQNKNADIVRMYDAIKTLQLRFANEFESEWWKIYQDNNSNKEYAFNAVDSGERSIKNLALVYLAYCSNSDHADIIRSQYKASDNMTDKISALSAITKTNSSYKDELLEDFYITYNAYPLVIDKWLRLQAADESCGIDGITNLMQHESFEAKNPNRVRSVLGSYESVNTKNFHDISGESYGFMMDEIIRIDVFNPQLAARLCEPFICWRLYDEKRQTVIRSKLEELNNTPGLSKDVHEIVSRSLRAR